MSHLDPVPIAPEEHTSSGRSRESLSQFQLPPLITKEHERLAELERENQRLHRLVAELLLKNEKLRKPV